MGGFKLKLVLIHIHRRLEEADSSPWRTKVVKISLAEVTTDEMGLKVGPEDVAQVLQSVDRTISHEEALLQDEPRAFEKEPTPGEDAVCIVAITQS